MLQISEHRIVLQQVRERFGVGQIVDGYKVDVRITDRSTIDVTSDATESIDTNLNGNFNPLLQSGAGAPGALTQRSVLLPAAPAPSA